MMPIPTASTVVATAVARNIDEFSEAVNSSFVPLKVATLDPRGCRAVIRAAGSSEIHLTEVRSTSCVVERTPELIAADERSYYKFSLMLSGHGMLIQDRREAVLAPGDLAMYDTSRPYSLVFDEDYRTFVVMLPRHLVSLPPHLVGELTAVRTAGSEGLGAVVASYLSQLALNMDQLSGPTGARLAHSALDLITTVLTHELGTVDADPHRTLMRRIYDYIDTNLAAGDLSVATVAAAHFISTRHLQGLFHEQGTTVSAWIREQRLERCRRDLVDRALADRSVAAIASHWGFTDASHFSRTFKEIHGVTPSEYRTSD